MIFNSKRVQLKNGTQVTIRVAHTNDAERLRNTISTYIKNSPYIPKFPEEITWTVRDTQDWIKEFEADNALLLVAEYDHQIIGNIDVTGHHRKAMAHSAVIGMGMVQEWRNTGLGTILMKCVLDWAKANAALELLWLQVYTVNKPAIHLYSKMGFKESGIVKNYFKQDGCYYDNMTMVKHVK